MKKSILSVISAVLIGTLLVGCSADKTAESTSGSTAAESETAATAAPEAAAAASQDSDAQDTITIRSCFTTGMTGAVNNFAIEKGLYRELGIEFDIVQAEDNQGRLSLISRGEIDVADGDPSSYIPGINNGVPAKLVGNMWRYSGCYWLVANNEIQSFEDLKGKTIGTAGASGGMKLSVLKMLEKNGISEDEVNLVANGTYQKAYATLTSGEVDATIIHNPYASLAEAEGIGHPLGRAWDYIPDYYTGTIIASNDMIENRPEDLQRFLTAYYKVHEEVKNEYFDEFITWASKYMNTSEEIMRDAVESEIDVWLDYPVIPQDRLEKTFEYLKQYGWVDDGVTPEGTYTNEFAQKAADELGMKDPESK
ncbi:MAG: ABC transporter substrate-binding protein [Lachnospiraceae bacterium]|nr:ABC transporter substrate-binding protein [Lachnospiraceae bacterium]